MRYLFLTYADEQWRDAMSTAERDTFERACRFSDEALRESGHLLAVECLQGNDAVATVQMHNGRVSLTDGPRFGANEQQLIGLFFIDARDLNEAIHVAATMPQVRGGLVEVRPMISFDHP